MAPPPRPFLPDRPVDDAQSLALLERGGVPLRAQRRIAEMRAQGHALTTSTLSPSETVVARATGLEAISQVMGSSVYHVGWNNYVGYGGGELTALTAAYDHARGLALSRMAQEGALLGAHAVVGVVLEPRRHAWAGECVEFTAFGTAVRVAGMDPVQYPALTFMQADELYKLHNAGYWPAGIAMGNCFWYEPHADCVSEGNWFTAPLPTHNRAVSQARELSVARFRESAKRLGAHGVVGVRVRRWAYDREWGENPSHTSFHLEMMLLGTAVVRRGEAKPPARPLIVMDLRDKFAAQGMSHLHKR
jgi:uncharacterized protein YbjQ (UPF0145 family)